MKLSIVVPTYNVEKYIGRCLKSLYFQDVSHSVYEIIVINDGSTDKSLDVVQTLIAEWENVKIITQPNGGLSEARNTGLQLAQGEYIWFVDSDDWIEENSLASIIKHLEGIEILMIEHHIANDTQKIKNPIRIEEKEHIYNGIDILNQRNPQNCVPFYIYQKKLITDNQLRFRKGIYYEDSLFTPMILFYASTIRFIPTPIYNYYQRSGSITKSRITPKHCTDCIIIANELLTFIHQQKKMTEDVRYLLYNRVASVMGTFVLKWFKLDYKSKKDVLQVLDHNKHIVEYTGKSNRTKTYILLRLMGLIKYVLLCR